MAALVSLWETEFIVLLSSLSAVKSSVQGPV